MLKNLAICLLVLNGLAAVFGGSKLVLDRSGKSLQLPLEFLLKSPFHDYLVPGLVLFIVLGLGSLVIAGLALARNNLHPLLTAIGGSVIVAWIVIQILMIRVLFVLQYVIGGLGVLLLIIGIVEWRRQNYFSLNN